jgi:hypothetical protein
MIDFSVQTKALTALLQAATTLGTCNIERSNRINYDPGRCPWIGVYPGNLETAPKTLSNSTATWANTGEMQVVIQTMTYEENGAAASDELETLIDTVLAVVSANLTLGVTGTRVTRVSREYRYIVMDDDESGSLFFPQVVLKIFLDIRSAG